MRYLRIQPVRKQLAVRRATAGLATAFVEVFEEAVEEFGL